MLRIVRELSYRYVKGDFQSELFLNNLVTRKFRLMKELKFVYELRFKLVESEKERVAEQTLTYSGNDWEECCNESAGDKTQDKTGIPTNEDGSITETRKTLLRILEKKEQDEWVEVSGEVYDYFEERVFIENNLEANRRLKEQFMSN